VKLNLFYGYKQKVYSPAARCQRAVRVDVQSHYRAFYFAESTVTKATYLDTIQQFVVPQVEDLQPTVIFQQDGAPPHWGRIVRDCLDTIFPNSWLGGDGPLAWPPRPPDITLLDFFLWGYVKEDLCYQGYRS
jgi:hypothetical protein